MGEAKRSLTVMSLSLLAANAHAQGLRPFAPHPQVQGSFAVSASAVGAELGGGYVFQPIADRWFSAGPRGLFLLQKISGLEFQVDALIGGEGILWVGNAIGPGLGIDWIAGSGDFRFEGFTATRIAHYADTGAWSVRAGVNYDTRGSWTIKLGLALEINGVPE